MMAAELHLDVALAKRGGLLHDVGKVLTHEHEGTHVELGVEVARRTARARRSSTASRRTTTTCRTRAPSRCWCRPPTRSAAPGPGARREAFETYVKRLTRLEEIANGFPGRGEEQRDPGRARGARGGDAGADRRRAPRRSSRRPSPGGSRTSCSTRGRSRSWSSGRRGPWITHDERPHSRRRAPRRRDPRGGGGGGRSACAAAGGSPGWRWCSSGEDPASEVYVKAKGKACDEAGMHSETIRLPESDHRGRAARGGRPAQRRSRDPRHPGAAAAAEAHRQRAGAQRDRSRPRTWTASIR